MIKRKAVSRALGFTCKAVLFDLDGVLVDSAEGIERSWRAWAETRQLDPDEVVRAAHGRRMIDTIRFVAPHLDIAHELSALVRVEASETAGLRPFNGARELLLGLPAGSWAIVTSAVREVAEFRLSHLAMPIPNVLVAADEVSHGKPHPEGYLAAAARLGAGAAECVVVEDAPPGIAAARAADMRVVAIATTHDAADLSEADVVVRSLGQIAIENREHRLVVTVRPN